MIETNEKTDYKKLIVALMFLGLIVGLIVGIVLGIELYQVTSTKLGFWEETVEATHIAILTLRHQIQSSNRIRTTIGMGNTGDATIHCNCTLYYKNALNTQLAIYSFNATINIGQTHSEAFVVTPINVSQWTGTDISIFEY